ncbi:MAG: gluconate 2-dehydrogenase subunit 3 family protein [Acidobacteriota bacterium]|nr:gluconate 2-dehydrogenase subunit 3 family protein [Acidobacteriota bacterium]
MQQEEQTPSPKVTRRTLVSSVGTGLIAIAVIPAAGVGRIQAPDAASTRLTSAEHTLFESFAETLLPGSAQAGIVDYLHAQLASPAPLLFLRYMDYTDSYIDFYRKGLKALEHQSEMRFNRSFPELEPAEKIALVRDLSAHNPSGWEGPPAPLFYFVVRNDAVDVYYGTPQGFKRLGIPYMAINYPPRNW